MSALLSALRKQREQETELGNSLGTGLFIKFDPAGKNYFRPLTTDFESGLSYRVAATHFVKDHEGNFKRVICPAFSGDAPCYVCDECSEIEDYKARVSYQIPVVRYYPESQTWDKEVKVVGIAASKQNKRINAIFDAFDSFATLTKRHPCDLEEGIVLVTWKTGRDNMSPWDTKLATELEEVPPIPESVLDSMPDLDELIRPTPYDDARDIVEGRGRPAATRVNTRPGAANRRVEPVSEPEEDAPAETEQPKGKKGAWYKGVS